MGSATEGRFEMARKEFPDSLPHSVLLHKSGEGEGTADGHWQRGKVPSKILDL